MLDRNQRWRYGRDSYRRPDEPINPMYYDVDELRDDGTAKRFVEQHHYSGSYPAARFRFGLYNHGQLVGVSVFSHPVRAEVLTSVFPASPQILLSWAASSYWMRCPVTVKRGSWPAVSNACADASCAAWYHFRTRFRAPRQRGA